MIRFTACEATKRLPATTRSINPNATTRSQDEEDAINEGLEADAADARAADAHTAGGEAADAPPPPPLPPPPAPEVYPDEVDDGTPEAEDVDGLLSRPPHSTEVFVSGLARSTSEEELRAAAAPHGEIFELRMLKDATTGQNRGYAFVCFCRREDAAAAVEALNAAELKGRKLRASLSPSKHRLFVGGLPKERFAKENLERVLRRAVVGVEAVELPSDAPGRTRGFAFVDFYNTAAAEKARRTLGSAAFSVRGRGVNANWAEKTETDAVAAANIKSLYVANLPENCRPEALKSAFEQFGDIERVVIPAVKSGGGAPGQPGQLPMGPGSPPVSRARYGFVHFVERSAALAATDYADKIELEGNVLEVSLAKPEQRQAGPTPSQLPPVVGAAIAAATMGRGGMGAGGIGPRGGYGRPGAAPMQMPMAPQMAHMGPLVPQGMALAPVMMPNGQVAYVMQQAGGVPQFQGGMPQQQGPPFMGGRGGGGRGWGGRGGGRHNDRYRPY